MRAKSGTAPANQRPPQRKPYNGAPKIAGSESTNLGETAREISRFIRNFETDRALQYVENVGAIPAPSDLLERQGGGSDKLLMKKFGWYWEPLYHDLSFFEEMRDSVATIAGAYEAFADFAISGFKVAVDDPQANDKLQKILFNPRANFYEVVRRSIFEVASIGNTYTIPIYQTTFKDGFGIKNFRPVRASAMRVLRDEDLACEGFVQLLHRPTEFLAGKTPSTPTFWLPDEVCFGYTYTKNWYAYGAPPFASLPFVIRLKLTMERDIAEILHKHVPRLDIKYTPEQQMTQEKVDAQIGDLKSQLAAMQAQQDLVHTPDVEAIYIGPNGKMVDATGTQNHVEDQIFRVLPMTSALLGAALNVNPELADQQWRIQTLRATNIRKAIETQFQPVMERLQKELKLEEIPKFGWDSLDEQTQKTQAETHELQISNANTMRDSGLISQDEAARHATKNSSEPRQDAEKDGPLPPVVDPNKIQPGGAKPAGSKVGDSKKGPSGRKTPKSDPRPPNKRHAAYEIFESIFDAAMNRIEEIGPLGLAAAFLGEGICQTDNPEEISQINVS